MFQQFMNSKRKVKILKFLVFNIGKSYTMSEIARLCRISKSWTSEVLREFEQAGILNSVAVGKSILYSLNLNSSYSRILIALFSIEFSNKKKNKSLIINAINSFDKELKKNRNNKANLRIIQDMENKFKEYSNVSDEKIDV